MLLVGRILSILNIEYNQLLPIHLTSSFKTHCGTIFSGCSHQDSQHLYSSIQCCPHPLDFRHHSFSNRKDFTSGFMGYHFHVFTYLPACPTLSRRGRYCYSFIELYDDIFSNFSFRSPSMPANLVTLF